MQSLGIPDALVLPPAREVMHTITKISYNCLMPDQANIHVICKFCAVRNQCLKLLIALRIAAELNGLLLPWLLCLLGDLLTWFSTS